MKYLFLAIAGIYIFTMMFQFGLFVHFKANQTDIAKEYCINKDKPELQCNGHCHLQKELSEVSDLTNSPIVEKEQKSHSQNYLLSFFLGYGSLVFNDSTNFIIESNRLLCWSETNSKSDFLLKIWTPPKV
ncbi:MAG: hypothetical protein H6600_07575 [Flavobacteriales bacterium]|nr:hypothetical protein [Flavobacteriales bacterium]